MDNKTEKPENLNNPIKIRRGSKYKTTFKDFLNNRPDKKTKSNRYYRGLIKQETDIIAGGGRSITTKRKHRFGKGVYGSHPTGNKSDNFVLRWRMGKGVHKGRKDVDIATLLRAGGHNVDDSYYYTPAAARWLNEFRNYELQSRRQFLLEELYIRR